MRFLQQFLIEYQLLLIKKYLNMSNITINSTGEISDITIVDSPNRHILQISEHLRNIRRGHHSKYMVNERKNDTTIQKYVDTPSMLLPLLKKNNS